MDNYFSPAELQCKCGCGISFLRPSFLTKLNNLRGTYYHKPLIVSSGFRCMAHDKAVGGSGENHPRGFAIDLIVAKGQDLMDVVTATQAVGIRRVIVYHDKPHIHLDDNPGLTPGLHIK